MKRFELDAEQTDAILELKIYRLARLEILIIRNELEEKRKRARQIGALLKDEDEPLEARARPSSRRSSRTYGDEDRQAPHAIASDTGEPEYSADDFIVEEDNVVIVSRDGWVKRQKEVKDLTTTRLREGDAVLAAFAGSTRATVRLLHQLRRRLHVPHHRRAGVDRLRRADPAAVQAEGRREDRRRAQPRPARRRRRSSRSKEGAEPAPVHAVAVTSDGYACASASSRSSSRARAPAGASPARPKARKSSASAKLTGREMLIAATAEAPRPPVQGREVNYLSGPGKGVILIKLASDDDRVLGFIASTGDRDLLTVETTRGGEQTISTAQYEVTGRGGKGRELLQRGQFTRIVWPLPDAPPPLQPTSPLNRYE